MLLFSCPLICLSSTLQFLSLLVVDDFLLHILHHKFVKSSEREDDEDDFKISASGIHLLAITFLSFAVFLHIDPHWIKERVKSSISIFSILYYYYIYISWLFIYFHFCILLICCSVHLFCHQSSLGIHSWLQTVLC